jgi:hypothetical protein
MSRIITITLLSGCLLISGLLFSSFEVSAGDKPLLSVAIRNMIDSKGVDVATKYFANDYAENKNHYQVDQQGIVELGTNYARAGNPLAMQAVFAIGVPYINDAAVAEATAKSDQQQAALDEARKEADAKNKQREKEIEQASVKQAAEKQAADDERAARYEAQPSKAPEQAKLEKSVQAQSPSNFNYPWEFISFDMKPEEVEQLLLDRGYKQGKDCRIRIYEGTSFDGRYINCTYEAKWQGKWPSAIYINTSKKTGPDQLNSLSFMILYPDSFANEARENFLRFAPPIDSQKCRLREKPYSLSCYLVKDIKISASRGVDYFHDYVINFPYHIRGWQYVTYNTSVGSIMNGFKPHDGFIKRFKRSHE